MIISHKHKYVYIGIPRTGAKSMNHWLTEYYDGHWGGGHHDYNVPQEAKDYLIFTIVRNPYDRRTSGYFTVTWDDQAPTDEEIGPCSSEQERLRKFRAILKTRQKQVQKDLPKPTQSPVPLDERIREAVAVNEADSNGINQKRFVDRAGVKLVLYFERLPDCLKELPFVDPKNVPPFPHHPERGIRPPGTYFDFFKDPDGEQVVWAHAAEDFEAFGYRRYDCGLPEDAPDALWLKQRPCRGASQRPTMWCKSLATPPWAASGRW